MFLLSSRVWFAAPRARQKKYSKKTWLALEPEYGLVPLPDEPGDREEPEVDNGRVGREDLTIILWGVTCLYNRDRLVLRQTNGFEPTLGRVVEDYGPHRGELAAPDLLAGLGYVRWCLGGLYEKIVPRLLESEVVVGGAVARGDAYPRLLGLRAQAEVGGTRNLDVVAELRARRQNAAVELFDAELRRRAQPRRFVAGHGARRL